MIDNHIPMILASASPRRAALLRQAGFTFTVIPSTIEEKRTKTSPDELSEDLAYQKANDVYRQVRKDYADRDYMVIGADTIVSYQGELLGKPADEQEAFDMLKLLSDRTHQVYTGLAILLHKDGEKQIYLMHECTDVSFYPISDYDIRDYIATGDPLDKAGAYGIQGAFAVHVKRICGDYNNVVGLPIARLYQAIKG